MATGGVNRVHDDSLVQKIVFWGLHLLSVAFAAWLLYGGVAWLGSASGFEWTLGDPVRGRVMLACAVLYWLRHGVTLFWLLARRVGWGEVLGLSVFFGLFEIGLVVVGGGLFREHPVPWGAIDVCGVLLVLAGSALNSGSEIQRKLWKQNAANRGHCYTGGLFRYSMHINYFGDIVLFTGWALLSASLWTLALPALMAYMFITIHIPGLDAYLAERYGEEFREYAARTKKLVPLIY